MERSIAAVPDYLIRYLPIVLLGVLAVGFSGGAVLLSYLMGPKKPTPEKSAPYECGITPLGTARERFPVKFYLVAMLFIIFDIETIFLYPWAVMLRQLKLFGIIEMAVFIAILLVGYFYILGKGALEWEE
ncbi:MAG: NADH-quinone oxidoreductase subunit A [Armatimonadetes bacterium]|nr:NADH-quinone oxidoreductase subunit A [Armatimonadota bacterium]